MAKLADVRVGDMVMHREYTVWGGVYRWTWKRVVGKARGVITLENDEKFDFAGRKLGDDSQIKIIYEIVNKDKMDAFIVANMKEIAKLQEKEQIIIWLRQLVKAGAQALPEDVFQGLKRAKK